MRSSDWSSDVCSSDLFSHAEVGEADSARPLGWIVENTAIRRASLDGALALAEGAGAKIDLRAPGDIVEVTRHSGGVTARLADGSTVRARLLGAADGRPQRLPDCRADIGRHGVCQGIPRGKDRKSTRLNSSH